jgi:hypothetical protein
MSCSVTFSGVSNSPLDSRWKLSDLSAVLAVETRTLDPCASVLHTIQQGSPSLGDVLSAATMVVFLVLVAELTRRAISWLFRLSRRRRMKR